MINLEDFKKNNLKINWKLLDIGFSDNLPWGKELTSKEIIDYAISQIDTDDEMIIRIAASSENEYDTIRKFVKRLALKEKSDYEIAIEKWKVIFVIKNLPKKNDDFILGLIELGDIWVELDFPDDSPHIFQGRMNEITPELYYTKKNYEYLYQKNVEWIEKTLLYLKDK